MGSPWGGPRTGKFVVCLLGVSEEGNKESGDRTNGQRLSNGREVFSENSRCFIDGWSEWPLVKRWTTVQARYASVWDKCPNQVTCKKDMEQLTVEYLIICLVFCLLFVVLPIKGKPPYAIRETTSASNEWTKWHFCDQEETPCVTLLIERRARQRKRERERERDKTK